MTTIEEAVNTVIMTITLMLLSLIYALIRKVLKLTKEPEALKGMINSLSKSGVLGVAMDAINQARSDNSLERSIEAEI